MSEATTEMMDEIDDYTIHDEIEGDFAERQELNTGTHHVQHKLQKYTVAKLQEEYPHLPCMMLSAHRKHTYVQRSLDAGARGYVTEDSVQPILEGVEVVLRGEIYLRSDVRELQD